MVIARAQKKKFSKVLPAQNGEGLATEEHIQFPTGMDKIIDAQMAPQLPLQFMPLFRSSPFENQKLRALLRIKIGPEAFVDEPGEVGKARIGNIERQASVLNDMETRSSRIWSFGKQG